MNVLSDALAVLRMKNEGNNLLLEDVDIVV